MKSNRFVSETFRAGRLSIGSRDPVTVDSHIGAISQPHGPPIWGMCPGKCLDSGACLTGLKRTSISEFQLADAMNIEEFEKKLNINVTN